MSMLACSLLVLASGLRASAQLSTASGAIEIAGGTSTCQIERPGTYFLSGDLITGSNDGIQILASNVTLDLNGHAISTVAAGAAYNNAVTKSLFLSEIIADFSGEARA